MFIFAGTAGYSVRNGEDEGWTGEKKGYSCARSSKGEGAKT